MADSPAWTRDIQSYTSARWVWRKEVTTITRWPLEGTAPEPPPQTTDAKSPLQATRPPDWLCACGQSNWAWRRICYLCYVPKEMDAANTTTSTGAIITSASAGTSDERIKDNKPSMPASSSSGNHADTKATAPGTK